MKTVIIYILLGVTIFIVGYVATDITYTRLMDDFVEPSSEQVRWEDEIKVEPVPKDSFQNHQTYQEQPAVTPIGKEL